MGFYEFTQNNSGGKFHLDDVICHAMYIEANSPEEANKKFLDWGGYFDGVSAGIDCGCCGDRWDEAGEYSKKIFPLDFGDGTTLSNTKDYVKHVALNYGKLSGKVYRIFYEDGSTYEASMQTGELKERCY